MNYCTELPQLRFGRLIIVSDPDPDGFGPDNDQRKADKYNKNAAFLYFSSVCDEFAAELDTLSECKASKWMAALHQVSRLAKTPIEKLKMAELLNATNAAKYNLYAEKYNLKYRIVNGVLTEVGATLKEPKVRDWYELTQRKDQFGMGTNPQNPECSIWSDGCSTALSTETPGVCFWHSHRMARIEMVRCGCRTNECLVGDATGRHMRREYASGGHDGVTLIPKYSVVDSGGFLYCCSKCQNNDNYTMTCGEMRVCNDCSDCHDH
jgi:hypothetical protein